ncbi:MAG: gamma-glutamylcyclotransferase family protein [Candidatus Binataceae bacterium]
MDTANDKLFVYGALMNSAERLRLLGRDVPAIPARLNGYARGRNRYFFVTPKQGAEVSGEILAGLDLADFRILDRYEDLPRLYTRESIEVSDIAGNRVRCWIYLPTGWENDAG